MTSDAAVDRWARAGLAEGAGAVAAMLGVPVEVCAVEGHDAPPTVVRIHIEGDVAGHLTLLVADRYALVAPLGLRASLVDSAIDEVANILASHFVVGVSKLADDTDLGALAGADLHISPPSRVEPAEAIVAGADHHLVHVRLDAHVPVGVTVAVDAASVTTL